MACNQFHWNFTKWVLVESGAFSLLIKEQVLEFNDFILQIEPLCWFSRHISNETPSILKVDTKKKKKQNNIKTQKARLPW